MGAIFSKGEKIEIRLADLGMDLRAGFGDIKLPATRWRDGSAFVLIP